MFDVDGISAVLQALSACAIDACDVPLQVSFRQNVPLLSFASSWFLSRQKL